MKKRREELAHVMGAPKTDFSETCYEALDIILFTNVFHAGKGC